MRLELVLPHQMRIAQEQNWPLIIPAGNIEYHGEHLGLGCDGLIAQGIIDEVAKQIDCIVAPMVWYGPSSYAVAGPEFGSVDVDTDNFEKHVRDILRSLLEAGFRNIYVIFFHQSENGADMPMALSYLKSAKMLAFETMEKMKGRGWWGNEDNARYYDTVGKDENPFNWIQVIPLMDSSIFARTIPPDHAGKLETSMLLSLYPESVGMSMLSDDQPWFVREAKDASKELGDTIKVLTVENLVRRLTNNDS